LSATQPRGATVIALPRRETADEALRRLFARQADLAAAQAEVARAIQVERKRWAAEQGLAVLPRLESLRREVTR
jgi:hypothetical protein